MKSVKKLLSILMVLTLVLSLGATAFAAEASSVPSKDVTTTIEVKEQSGEAAGTYSAYQLFTLTTTADATENSSGYSYTVNEKYRGIMYLAAAVNSDEALLAKLEGFETNSDDLRVFADLVYGAIKQSNMAADYTSNDGKFTVPQGYYLIAEDGAAGGVTSQVMLDTAGRQNITVTTKEDKPSSEKKVLDNNDSENVVVGQPVPGDVNDTLWQDSADHDIGDTVYFKLTGKLPSDLDHYDPYKLVFHDKEGAGLQYVSGSAKVYVDGKLITTGYTVNEDPDDGDSFDVVFEDVKAIEGVKAGSTIVVVYGSKLDGTGVVIGNPGNPNEMYMEYTNDSYTDGTGKTPEDKVVVFTYDLDVNKVHKDAGGEMEPLEGAEFALYKEVKYSGSGAVQLTKDGKVATGAEGEELLAGWYVKVDLTKNSDGTTFTGKGIDDGNYVLVETVVPDGYNAIDPVKFTVSAEHPAESDNPLLSSVTGTEGFKFTLTRTEDGKAMGQTDIENQTGLELPETGGIGTTIFYVAGAVLVAAAVILLVTRKRMSGTEK